MSHDSYVMTSDRADDPLPADETIAKPHLADLILEVGKPNAQRGYARFHVNSVILRQSITFFDAMLDDKRSWQENATRTVQLEDDFPRAWRVILKIIHNRVNELPSTISRLTAYCLAVLCDKYDCKSIVDGHLGQTINVPFEREETFELEPGWLLACYYFGWKRSFMEHAQRHAFKLLIDESGTVKDCIGTSLTKWMCLWSEPLMEKLKEIRIKGLNNLISILHQHRQQQCMRSAHFSDGEIEECSRLCEEYWNLDHRRFYSFDYVPFVRDTMAKFGKSASVEDKLNTLNAPYHHHFFIHKFTSSILAFCHQNLATRWFRSKYPKQQCLKHKNCGINQHNHVDAYRKIKAVEEQLKEDVQKAFAEYDESEHPSCSRCGSWAKCNCQKSLKWDDLQVLLPIPGTPLTEPPSPERNRDVQDRFYGTKRKRTASLDGSMSESSSGSSASSPAMSPAPGDDGRFSAGRDDEVDDNEDSSSEEDFLMSE